MKIYTFCYKRKKGSKAKMFRLVFFELHRHPYYVMKNIEKVRNIKDNYKFEWYTEINILKHLFYMLPFYNNYKNVVKFK